MKKNIISLMIIAIVVILSGCSEKVEYRDIKSCVLSTNQSSEASGAFILGCGVFSTKENITTKYYMYIKGTEGFKLQEIDSQYLEIVETDEKQPQIKGSFSDGGTVKDYTDYVVYVPLGTITQEYKTDINIR